jgi:hypothetical protein
MDAKTPIGLRGVLAWSELSGNPVNFEDLSEDEKLAMKTVNKANSDRKDRDREFRVPVKIVLPSTLGDSSGGR